MNLSSDDEKPKKVRKLRQNEIFQMPKKEKKMTALEKKFKEHEKHHSKEHISFMKREMKDGLSFDKAHEMALKKDKKINKINKK
tara:strand:- start:815 stop:1066 length:252 start_codon:yes stop_codon:yes gene_type:complete